MDCREAGYQALVRERRACRACPGLANASAIRGGALDVHEVGAYAHWQGRLDADLALVAQDFASVDRFVASGGRPNPSIPTNKNMVALFRAAGLPLSLPSAESEDRYFFTNAVLCMKTGGMSAPVRTAHVRECARRFLRPTLELVRPRVAVALGSGALLGISEAFDLDYDGGPLRPLVERFATFDLPWGGVAVPAYHPSRLVGGRASCEAHWRRIAALLDESRTSRAAEATS